MRLSIDLDLNYRHLNTKDWGEVRNEIDEKVKELLYRQGYRKSDIAINASYPLARITVKYTNSLGLDDNFKIEMGYMRRIPILKTDTLKDFKHIGTQETFPIKSPIEEELFANKWCVLLYRGTARDVFDVYQISKTRMDLEVFRKCSIVDSLMQGKPELHKINIEETIGRIQIDSNLRNKLQTEQLSKLDFNEMREQTIKFSEEMIKNLTQNEIRAIERFFQLKIFEPNLIDEKGIFYEKVQDHPAIQWALRGL